VTNKPTTSQYRPAPPATAILPPRPRGAYLPALAVLATGAAGWLAAMQGADTLATRLMAAAHVVAWLATLASAARIRRPVALGLAASLAAKVATFFATVPAGIATLWLRWGEFYYDGDAWFWISPVVVAAITAAEGWATALVLSRTKLAETRIWSHRRLLVTGVVAAAVLGPAWFFGRTPLHLSRLRRGEYSGYDLAKVGPRALPAIYGEVDAIGARHVGRYREALFGVIAQIRHD